MDGGLAGARSPTWCCRAPAPAAGVPGAVLLCPRVRRPARPARGSPRRAGSRGASRRRPPPAPTAGRCGPARATPSRSAGRAELAAAARERRWPSPSPRSCSAVPAPARAGAAGAGAELGRRAAQPAAGTTCAELTGRAVAELRAAGLPVGAGAGCCAGAGGCATRPGCRPRQRRANLAGTFELRRPAGRPGGAAGARRRRRHQRRDAHRGGRGAVRGGRPGDPPVLARGGRGDPAAARRSRFAGRPARCPERPETSGTAPPVDCRDRGGGTSVEATTTRPTGRSHGDRCPWSQRRGSRALPPARRGQGRSARTLRRQAEDPPHRRGALPREEPPPVRRNCQRVEITLRGKGPVVRAEAGGARLLRRARPRRRQARQPAAPRGRPPPGAPRPAHPGQRAASTGNTAVDGDVAAAGALDLDRQLGRRAARRPTSTSTCPAGSCGRSTIPPPP